MVFCVFLCCQAKLKESQYQLTPWRSGGTSPNFAAQSPEDPSDAAFASV